MRLINLMGLFLLLLTSMSPVYAQSMQWDEAPQLEVRIDGQIEISTRAFQPEVYRPYILVQSSKLGAPVLLDLAKKTLTTLGAKALTAQGQYAVLTTGIPKGTSAGGFAVKAGVTTFTIGKKKVEIRTKESLVGEVSEGIILAHSPLYAKLRDSWTPKKSTVSTLAAMKTRTEIVVMFATWCPTCKVVLPRFLRLMKDAKNPAFSMRYIGLAMGGNEPRDAVQRYGHDYPAFIVFRNGKEVGRVVGDPPNFEATLLGVLSQH